MLLLQFFFTPHWNILVNVVSIILYLCCYIQMTAVPFPMSFLCVWTFLVFTLRIILWRWSTQSQFSDGRINTLYRSYPSHSSLVCFLWRVPESEIYSYLIPLPSIPPLGSLPRSLLFHPNDKTDRLKVCRCCRDLNHPRFSVVDYYEIVDSVWPEDIGQLVPP